MKNSIIISPVHFSFIKNPFPYFHLPDGGENENNSGHFHPFPLSCLLPSNSFGSAHLSLPSFTLPSPSLFLFILPRHSPKLGAAQAQSTSRYLLVVDAPLPPPLSLFLLPFLPLSFSVVFVCWLGENENNGPTIHPPLNE